MPNKIEICDEKGNPRVYIYVHILPNGDLQMAGHDIGELCERMFGREEHEYWVTVPAAEKDNLLLSLIADLYRDNVKADVEFQELLKTKEIPFKFSTY